MKRIAIILAGGHGTRLWPLSTDKQPKPLLEVFNHKTMLENTIMRAKLFANEVFVLTDNEKKIPIEKAINDLGLDCSVIVEPAEAGTAAAIAYAIANIKSKFDDEAVVTFLPVDHSIKNLGAFYRDANFAAKAAAKSNIVTLFGIVPSFAATGYGYMKLGEVIEKDELKSQFVIDKFLEKPDYATAKKFLNDNKFVWNSGIYIGTIYAFESLFKIEKQLFDWYQKIISDAATELPLSLKNAQLEQTLVERATSLNVVLATFDWADIGTYDMLHHSALEIDKDDNTLKGNVVIDDCKDCLILGKNKKIVALGLDDIAVVDGSDGILVCKKSTYSQLVGKVATGEQQPKEYHE